MTDKALNKIRSWHAKCQGHQSRLWRIGNLKMDVQEEEMVQNAARKIDLAGEAKDAVRKILNAVKADKRTSLTAPEGKLVCDA